MEPAFWHAKWEQNSIGFHQPEANPLLTEHWRQLQLAPGARVFVPLCGKTLDIHWLLDQGYRVVGAELSELAIGQLFAELGKTPVVTRLDGLIHYQAANIDVFVGDIFALTPPILGPVDAVYDRAALIALPAPLRDRYVSHLAVLAADVPHLLVSLEYDPTLMSGPPFSVPQADVHRLYQATHQPTPLKRDENPTGLKGKWPSVEQVWHLIPHHRQDR